MKRMMAIVTMASVVLTAGCTGMTARQQSTLSGAGIGAVGGGLLGAASGGSATTGAVIGAGVGGAAGYLLEK